MNEKIVGQTFDQERALYNLKDTQVIDCIFAGPADGESALKESRDVALKNCRFSLRYPLWHSKKFLMEDSSMDELTRAAIWYASDGTIQNSILGGIKCLRECDRMKLDGCTIHSPEFGWKCRDLEIKNSPYLRILQQLHFSFSTPYFYCKSKNTILFYFLTHKKGRYPLNLVSAFSTLLSILLLSFFSNTDFTG